MSQNRILGKRLNVLPKSPWKNGAEPFRMTCQEDQEEEIEVLTSIYEGDECFKTIDKTTYQYKIGEDGSYKSFVLEVKWGENYPEEMPTISMDAFYNKHIVPEVKKKIVDALIEQGEASLGLAMTYTLFEYVKEEAESLLEDQPETPVVQEREEKEEAEESSKAPKERKEQYTKAQKRKLYNRLNTKGEMPRGYDWVDIVKHLSQTGRAFTDET